LVAVGAERAAVASIACTGATAVCCVTVGGRCLPIIANCGEAARRILLSPAEKVASGLLLTGAAAAVAVVVVVVVVSAAMVLSTDVPLALVLLEAQEATVLVDAAVVVVESAGNGGGSRFGFKLIDNRERNGRTPTVVGNEGAEVDMVVEC
jgi:hypothetical protein